MGAVSCLRPTAVAVLMAVPALAQAQAFTADYALTLDARAPGAGLAFHAGRNWFAGLAQGQPGGIVNVAGGYRWADGRSLSLQLTRARGPGQRLGLSLNYDWPRYFVRLSFDHQALNPVPQDSFRFSAGVRF
jgi:hypothetical protein